MNTKVKAEVIDGDGLRRTITRLAHEIIERNRGADNVVVIGVRTRGAYIAERLVKKIEEIEKKTVHMGALDVTLYRDDFRKRLMQPVVQVS